MEYFNGFSYIWMAIFIMIAAGLAKEFQLFSSAHALIKKVFKSNKAVVVMLAAIGGILPISGRVTVSAGLLDTVAPKDSVNRAKYGVIDYIATHHYYMWSPLEKTVILPIAILGISYFSWITMILPLLGVSLAFIGWYVWVSMKSEDIHIIDTRFNKKDFVSGVMPMFVAIAAYAAGLNPVAAFGLLAAYYAYITKQTSFKKLVSFINWEVVLVVGLSILAANFFASHKEYFEEFILSMSLDKTSYLDIIIVSLVGFVSSFLMGSSGKFVAIAVLMAQVFGMEYFLWFFAVDYVGYLISPTHKCVLVGSRYFGTPLLNYYKALLIWSILLLTTSAFLTFII